MTIDEARFVDRTTYGPLSIEIAFNGGSKSPLGNPPNTNVVVRFLDRANPQWEPSPWIERWSHAAGDPIMPSGAWNGVKLAEIIGNRVFVAIGNELSEFNVHEGKPVWTLATGNTPIRWIMKSRDEASLIVFNEYFGFKRGDQKVTLQVSDSTELKRGALRDHPMMMYLRIIQFSKGNFSRHLLGMGSLVRLTKRRATSLTVSSRSSNLPDSAANNVLHLTGAAARFRAA